MIKRTLCFILAIVCIAAVIVPVSAEETSQPVSVSYKNKDKVEAAILDFIEENKKSTPSVSITVLMISRIYAQLLTAMQTRQTILQPTKILYMNGVLYPSFLSGRVLCSFMNRASWI